jgi:hypothetical protein
MVVFNDSTCMMGAVPGEEYLTVLEKFGIS